MPALPPEDLAVPALGILLGAEAGDVLNAGIEGSGAQVVDFRATSVRYRPEKSVTVQYRATLRDSAGKTSRPTMVASSGLPIPDGRTTLLRSEDLDVAVWKFPYDPFLPGLPTSTDQERAAELVTRLGAPTDSVRIRTRAYRAGRRAVIEAAGDSGTVYMKVLRPNKAAALQARHVDLAPHLPIPRSLGWSRDLGVVAMQALGGTTLRSSLEAGILELPSPRSIVSLLDQFPAPKPDATIVRAAHQRTREHARLLSTILPSATDLLDRIVTGVGEVTNEGQSVAVHGDFHSSQILIDGGRVVGLVDVDTAGAGERSDDLAAMLGQLATLGITAENRSPFRAYNTLCLAEFEREVDGSALRRRVAAAILGLATGPFRVQLADWQTATERRLRLAQLWLDSTDSGKDPINP